MEPDVPTSPEREAMWRGILLGTDPRYRERHWLFRRLPADPRCKVCSVPFGGPIGRVLRIQGLGPWPKNPKYCGRCWTMLRDGHGGAEIPCSVLFADVRGSTGLAETMSASAFRDLLNRFYAVATHVLIHRDAMVDKYVGDEVMAVFIPALTGDLHAARALEAARDLLVETGHTAPDGPWIPVGVGIATGIAYVGAVGSGDSTELTALGDIVNVGARLASAARAGEILVTDPARAGLGDFAQRRSLEVRGKSEPVEVAVVTLGPEAAEVSIPS
jgi:adenylate cyclase